MDVDLPHAGLVIAGFPKMPRRHVSKLNSPMLCHVVVIHHKMVRLAGLFSSPLLPHNDRLGIKHPPTPCVLMLVFVETTGSARTEPLPRSRSGMSLTCSWGSRQSLHHQVNDSHSQLWASRGSFGVDKLGYRKFDLEIRQCIGVVGLQRRCIGPAAAVALLLFYAALIAWRKRVADPSKTRERGVYISFRIS